MGSNWGNLARTEGRQRAFAVARTLGKVRELDSLIVLIKLMVKRTPERAVNQVQTSTLREEQAA